jgi:drug/metabolite transporter (DMT)-like permease
MRNPLSPGMRYMLLGTFLFSIGSLLIKLTGERVPTLEMLFVRGVVGIGFVWAILRRTGVGMLGTRRVLLALRGLVGFVALFAEFYAIVHLPLADATVILFTHPAVVALLAWAVLGERIGVRGLVAVAVSLSGVAVVCRPAFLFGGGPSALDPLAVSVALGAVVVTSLAILTVRALAKTEHPAVVMLYPPLIISIVSPFLAEGWVMPTPLEWLFMFGIALFMNGGQYYMTRGYAIESAARISAVTCLEVVFAAFWGASVLGEIPDAWTLCGGLLIVAGTLALGRGDGPDTAQESAA